MCLVLYYAVKKLNNNADLHSFQQLIASIDANKATLILTSLLGLMLLNWFLECVKWQYLCRRVEKISLWRAVQSVFCGLSWAVFTPNRIGEYGGRVMFLSPRKRVYGVVGMGVGALAQLVITNTFGALACSWFLISYQQINGGLGIMLVVLAILVAIGFMVLYFNIKVLDKWLRKIAFLKRFYRFFSLLGRYGRTELVLVFLISLMRYAVFSTQYFMLLRLLGIDASVFALFGMIFLLFFIQSALPSLDLLDVGVRSLTAGYIFSFVTDQELTVMAVVASVWFVNLILPAIMGLGFVLKMNLFGTSNIK